MSMIQCPECGTYISDRARTCPYCGYQGSDCSIEISKQAVYDANPVFIFDIEDEEGAIEYYDLQVLSCEDNRKLVEFFSRWDNVKHYMPALADVMKRMAKKNHILIAKMDDYIKKMISEGVYKFSIDADGNILPTIINSETKRIVKQVRLESIAITPNVLPALGNLAVQAVLEQILEEINCLEEAMQALHNELQNDRYANVESAFDLLNQARRINDTKLRNAAILSAISDATKAKRQLMRNFMHSNANVMAQIGKSDMSRAVRSKRDSKTPQYSKDALFDLIYIANAVRTECMGYAMLNEPASYGECLSVLRKFILDNHLDDRDTLLLLNESAPNNYSGIVDTFETIAIKTKNFQPDLMRVSENLKGVLPL